MSFQETFNTFRHFMDTYEGNMMCGCDHGCNQWLKKQETRMAMSHRMIRLGSKNLDKLAKMPIQRINRIWRWIYMNDVRRFNARMDSADIYTHFLLCKVRGLETVDASIRNSLGDLKFAALSVDMKPYHLRSYLQYQSMSDSEKAKCLANYEWQLEYYKGIYNDGV